MGKSRMKSDSATLAAGYSSVLGFNLRQIIRWKKGKMENGKCSLGYEILMELKRRTKKKRKKAKPYHLTGRSLAYGSGYVGGAFAPPTS